MGLRDRLIAWPTSLAAVAVLSGLPRAAAACAVCTVGLGEDTRSAFIWTTVFMSVLPLGAIAVGVLWLRKAMSRARLAERKARELAEPGRAAAPTR